MQIIVRDNNVDQALRALKKKLQREGVYREMKLRRHFEVDRFSIAYTALQALAESNIIALEVVLQARERWGIDPASPEPVTL